MKSAVLEGQVDHIFMSDGYAFELGEMRVILDY